MKRLVLLLSLTALFCVSVSAQSTSRTSFRFRRLPTFTICRAGDVAFNTGSSTFQGCTATNTVVTLASSAGASIPAVTQGDLLFGSGANALSALAKNASATRYLSNTGSSNNPAWAQIDLTNGVTNTLPVGNGGTGVATITGLLSGNGTANLVGRTITAGSASIVVTNGSGATANPTVDTAQNIQTTATPQFLRLGLNQAADATAGLSVTGTASPALIIKGDASAFSGFMDFIDTGASGTTYRINHGAGAGGRLTFSRLSGNNAFQIFSTGITGFMSDTEFNGNATFGSADGGTADVGLKRNAAGLLEVNSGTGGTLRDLTTRNTNAATYTTATNCTDSAGAAACGSASAGSVVLDAAATTVVVSTTAVTANSQIFIQEDSSLGTRLSVTCNTTTGRDWTVSARTAATSFTITSSAAPATNPACLSYHIVN